LHVAEDGSYTIRTTEINENGDEVEVVRTVSAEECAASQGGVVQVLNAPNGQMMAVQEESKLYRYKIEEKRVFIMDGKSNAL
jgi:hypothetical protein